MNFRPAILFKGHGVSWYTEIPRPLLALPGCSKLSGVDLRKDGVIRSAPGRLASIYSHQQLFGGHPVTSAYPFVLPDKEGGLHYGLALSDGQDLVIMTRGTLTPVPFASVGTLGTTWRFVLAGYGLIAVNGTDAPFQIVWDLTTGDYAKKSYGLPAMTGSFTVSSSSSGGHLGQGTFKVRLRGWDENTNSYTPVTSIATYTTSSSTGTVSLVVNISNVSVDARVTKLQVLRSQANDSVFYVDESVSRTDGSFPTSVTLTQSDTNLVADLNSVVLSADLVKSLPPMGSLIWNFEDMVLIAGRTASSYSGSYPKIQHPSWLYYSSPYHTDYESFDPDGYIPIGQADDGIVGGAQYGDYFFVFGQRHIYSLQKSSTKISVVDRVQGHGAKSPEAIISTPYGVVFQSFNGLFLTTGDTPFEIGRPIRDWVLARDLVLAWDDTNQLLYAQDRNGSECAICWINTSSQVRWSLREGHPGRWIFSGVSLEDSSGVPVLYTLLDTDDGLVEKPLWVEEKGTSHGVTAKFTVTSGTGCQYNATAKTLTFDTGTYGTLSHAVGSVIRVVSGTSKGQSRMITAQSSGVLTHDGLALTLTAGDIIIMGNIPFSVRFPPIVGTDPFTRKVTTATQVIGWTLNPAETVDLKLTTTSNLDENTAPDSGGTITLRGRGQNTSAQNAVSSRADGRMVEVELSTEETCPGGFDLYFVQTLSSQTHSRMEK